MKVAAFWIAYLALGWATFDVSNDAAIKRCWKPQSFTAHMMTWPLNFVLSLGAMNRCPKMEK